MKFSFDTNSNLIVVSADVHGASGMVRTRLAVDTGATGTILSPSVLAAAGIDYQPSTPPAIISTVNGRIEVSVVSLAALRTLGKTCSNLPILCYALSLSSDIDGLLGLDFLRNFDLHIDFRNGRIELT